MLYFLNYLTFRVIFDKNSTISPSLTNLKLNKNFIFLRTVTLMTSYSNFKNLLIIYISFILSMDTSAKQKEVYQAILKDLKNILYEFDCLGLGEHLRNYDMKIRRNFDPDEVKIHEFLNKPILISNLEFNEKKRVSDAILAISKYLETKRQFKIENELLKASFKTSEFFLFERMNLTLEILNSLSANIEHIKSETTLALKRYSIAFAKKTCFHLFNNLLLVRYASFMDYTHYYSEKEYDMPTKLELVNSIYSMAVQLLRELKNLLN